MQKFWTIVLSDYRTLKSRWVHECSHKQSTFAQLSIKIPRSLYYKRNVKDVVFTFDLKSAYYHIYVLLENFSFIRRRYHYRWRAPNFHLYSALMAIEQWGLFSEPHLLWRRASVYNGHLRGTLILDTRTCPCTKVIDAFTRVWLSENNWLSPSTKLISKVFYHMMSENTSGTLIIPEIESISILAYDIWRKWFRIFC